jgi:hypothetical protein
MSSYLECTLWCTARRSEESVIWWVPHAPAPEVYRLECKEGVWVSSGAKTPNPNRDKYITIYLRFTSEEWWGTKSKEDPTVVCYVAFPQMDDHGRLDGSEILFRFQQGEKDCAMSWGDVFEKKGQAWSDGKLYVTLSGLGRVTTKFVRSKREMIPMDSWRVRLMDHTVSMETNWDHVSIPKDWMEKAMEQVHFSFLRQPLDEIEPTQLLARFCFLACPEKVKHRQLHRHISEFLDAPQTWDEVVCVGYHILVNLIITRWDNAKLNHLKETALWLGFPLVGRGQTKSGKPYSCLILAPPATFIQLVDLTHEKEWRNRVYDVTGMDVDHGGGLTLLELPVGSSFPLCAPKREFTLTHVVTSFQEQVFKKREKRDARVYSLWQRGKNAVSSEGTVDPSLEFKPMALADEDGWVLTNYARPLTLRPLQLEGAVNVSAHARVFYYSEKDEERWERQAVQLSEENKQNYSHTAERYFAGWCVCFFVRHTWFS